MMKTAQNRGWLFLLVGNSGSGKDTLIRSAAQRWPGGWPDLYTPRRYITRPAHPSEPFIAVSSDGFQQLRRKGGLFLEWVSYGVHYGLPADIAAHLDRGAFVLANVSREVVARARARHADTRVVFIEVPLAVTAARLLRRGRELPGEKSYWDRLQRARQNPQYPEADLMLPNDGDLNMTAQELTTWMVSQARLVTEPMSVN